MKHLWNSWPIPTHLVARCLSCWVCGGTFAPPSRHRSGCSRTWRRNGGTWRWIWGSRFPVTVHYTVDTCCWLNIRVYVCVAIYHDHSLSQWEFQDPKMEVLYHIRQYFMGIFPYIGLIYIYMCVRSLIIYISIYLSIDRSIDLSIFLSSVCLSIHSI